MQIIERINSLIHREADDANARYAAEVTRIVAKGGSITDPELERLRQLAADAGRDTAAIAGDVEAEIVVATGRAAEKRLAGLGKQSDAAERAEREHNAESAAIIARHEQVMNQRADAANKLAIEARELLLRCDDVTRTVNLGRLAAHRRAGLPESDLRFLRVGPDGAVQEFAPSLRDVELLENPGLAEMAKRAKHDAAYLARLAN